MKILGKLPLVPASFAHPFLWYHNKEDGAFFWFATATCVLWLIRAAMPQTTTQRATAIILAVFFTAVLAFRWPDSACWYSVAIDTLMFAALGGSPFVKQTVIERLARL